MSQPNLTSQPQFGSADLTSCDREPIHIPGRVQAFGALIAMTRDKIIQHASANIGSVFGVSAQQIIGQPLAELASRAFIHDLLGAFQTLDQPDSVERLFRRQVREGGELFDVAVHFSGASIIVEFEAVNTDGPSDLIGYVRPMIDRVAKTENVSELCRIAARQIRALTGYERVMVYRFDDNASGEVIAEALGPAMESFLGLNFPASDIPKQARALYQRNMLRVIGDVHDDGVEIIPTLNPHGEPLDLSMSTTRAVSPIHLEYLKNMEVGGSMSISILRDGKLWGLFACHHPTSLIPSYPIRTAAELFAQLFTYLLESKENENDREAFMRGQILHDRIMIQLATDTSVSQNFEMIVEASRDVIPSDGAVGWINGVYQAQGVTPSEDEFKQLVPFLNTSAASRVFATDHLSGIFPDAAAYADRAAGLLVLPVSRSPRDFIVFFRSEIAKSVTWAGDPDKPVVSGKFGDRLNPRKSFEAWKQDVAGHCAAWTNEETRAADALRVTLMEVVLRLADSNLKDQARSHARQELLIAELNHRVRNILNLIKGLISQSADGHYDVSSLTGVIGGRIDALARAHDQITRQLWAPASLYDLIETECDAYLGVKADRVVITGPDAMLNPDAFSALSLVIHELMTNSAKYGALCDTRGRVDVTTAQQANGSLKLEWRETGGPAVQAPKRRGFGTTIIERSIPYELNGTSAIRYELTGVEVELTVPAAHIDEFRDRQESRTNRATSAVADSTRELGNVLVVEDNMIIALDAEVLMEELGAKTVSLASSVDHALRLIESTEFGFALLDVNLGSETSVAIAEKLLSKGVPFTFATGYGETDALRRQFPNAPAIQKPYDIDDIRGAIAQ